ncbi:terminase small subunit, partial [Candidatus Babeliales bacterium]|nr:terminase small subunit [Candidatus Babeliales bacterium]
MNALSKIAEMKPKEFNDVVAYNKKNNWPDLNSKQKMFAVRYLETYSATKAATEAGSASAGWGNKQLRDPLVLEYINSLQLVYNQRSFINKDFINVQMLQHLEVVKGEV